MITENPAFETPLHPESAPRALRVSRFTANKPARLSKQFTLTGPGILHKESGGDLTDGAVETLVVADLAAFAALLPTLTPKQALSYGINGHDHARVVAAAALAAAAAQSSEPVIARTREHFGWPAGAGLMMLDYDAPQDGPALDRDALRATLTAACPALADAPAVWRPSASSCIYTKEGAELRGIKGQRLYVAVADASDIPRALAVLFDRLWLAGFGYYELSKSGAWLARSAIDASVAQPERLDFCGGAACGFGLEQRLPAPLLLNPDAPYLDTHAALPDLDASERHRLAELREAAKEPLRDRQQQIRAEWVTTRVDARLSAIPEPDRAEARPKLEKVYRQAAEGGRLDADFELIVVTKGTKARKRITVGELLKDRARYQGATCLDPLEPDYPDGQGRLVGWLNLQVKEPYLRSHAHGGTRYTLSEVGHPAKAQPLPKWASQDPYRGTDDANAALFLELHGKDVRYCPPWEKWLIWTGSHWRIDDRLVVKAKAEDVAKDLYRRAADADPDQRVTIANLALSLEDVGSRSAMLLAAQHKVVIHHSDLDKGRFLLNCRNGTVDLRTGALRPHERLDLLTHDVEIDYRPDTAAPTWLRFLNDVFAHDAELIHFVQRAIGYSLTGDVREQVLLICHGSGSNGKSVFLNILRQLLGKLAWQAAPDLLLADRNRRHPTEQADLFGKRIIVCQETGEGRRFNETLVKQLTGGDAITARRMHEDFWSFEPTHKIWLSTNHRPEIRGTDYAIWRRVRLIPFAVQFSEESEPRKDPEMEARLLTERPGILAWAIRGCLDWQKHGLGLADAVKTATSAYQAEMDVLAGWIADCCVIHRNAKARASALYRSYSEWCEQSGEHPEPQRRWGMRLPERGFHRYSNDGVWYRGIGLRTEGTEGTELEKAIFPKNSLHEAKYAKSGSVGSVGSVNPPVSPPSPADAGLSSQHPPAESPPPRNAPLPATASSDNKERF